MHGAGEGETIPNSVPTKLFAEHRESNLTASAGVAPNKFLAKLASDWRKPDGLFVIQPEEVDVFLLPLPVGRLPGVGKVTEKELAKLRIHTLGELRGLELSTWSAGVNPRPDCGLCSRRIGVRSHIPAVVQPNWPSIASVYHFDYFASA